MNEAEKRSAAGQQNAPEKSQAARNGILIDHDSKNEPELVSLQNQDHKLAAIFSTHSATQADGVLKWGELITRLEKPVDLPKGSAPALAAHHLSTKTQTAIEKHDQMTLLWADVDDGDLSLDDLKTKAAGLGLDCYALYSTASSCRLKASANGSELKGKCWRVIVPLAEPIGVDRWLILQKVLITEFGGDIAAARVHQILYLPTRQPVSISDSQNGARDHYEHYHSDGELLQLTSDRIPTALQSLARAEYERQKVEEEREAERKTIRAELEKSPQFNPSGDDSSVIEAINRARPLVDVLNTFGYLQSTWSQSEYSSPNSSNYGKSFGVYISDDGNKWCSFHASDAGIGQVWKGCQFGDSFDLLVHYSYSGDRSRALKELADECDPEGQKQRRAEYAAAQASQVDVSDDDGVAAQVDEYADGEREAVAIKQKERFDSTLAELQRNPNNERAYQQALLTLTSVSDFTAKPMINELKQVTGLGVRDIKRGMKEKATETAVVMPGDDVLSDNLDHGSIARAYLGIFEKLSPVGVHGKLWLYNQDRGIFTGLELYQMEIGVSGRFSNQKLCRRGSDYKAIARLAYNMVKDDSYFEQAPQGICTAGGFYRVNDDRTGVEVVEHSPDNRSRFRIEHKPVIGGKPQKLLAALRDSFAGTHADEQIRQLRMLTGITLFGSMPDVQKAVLLYGVGGSFKSGFQKVLSGMLPTDAVCSVSPLEMDSDYKKASLAGKRLNSVPELSKDKPVPAAEFKAITGGDLVSARQPYQEVFEFTSTAANWFNSNFLLTTKDHSEGFWRRWAIVHFANGKAQADQNPNLVDEILEQEAAEFLGWAIEGAEDYLKNGLYLSRAHVEVMGGWKVDANSVKGWLHDPEEIDLTANGARLKVTEAYSKYVDWCRENQRRPYKSQEFRKYVEGSGFMTVAIKGYPHFCGLGFPSNVRI